MEEWFHDRSDKDEVIQARPMIARVLKMVQELFPRESMTNQYCIPKFHAMTKFQKNILDFGSAMIFLVDLEKLRISTLLRLLVKKLKEE